jgi:hypothetical protein
MMFDQEEFERRMSELNAALQPILDDIRRDIDAIRNAPWYVKAWWRVQTWGMRARDLLGAKDDTPPE